MVIMPMPVLLPVHMIVIVIVTTSRAVRVVVMHVVMVFVIVCMPVLLPAHMIVIVTASRAVRVVMHVVMVFVIVCMPMLLRMLARMPLGRFALRAHISACMCAPTAMSTAMPTLLPVLQLIIVPISVRMAATVLVPMPCVPHIPVCMLTSMGGRTICMR